jgi:hypothetical protein
MALRYVEESETVLFIDLFSSVVDEYTQILNRAVVYYC